MEQNLESVVVKLAETNVMLNSNMEDVVENSEAIAKICNDSLGKIKGNINEIEKITKNTYGNFENLIQNNFRNQTKLTSEMIERNDNLLKSNLYKMNDDLNRFATHHKAEIVTMYGALKKHSTECDEAQKKLFNLLSIISTKLEYLDQKSDIQSGENRALAEKLELLMIEQSQLNRKYNIVMFSILSVGLIAILVMISRLA